MKTVAFIDPHEEELWDAYGRYELLFEELRGRGAFAVCPWEGERTSVARAIPRLPELLEALGVAEGEEEWQALVVTDLRASERELSQDRHFDNPYDFPESYDVGFDTPFRESPHPVVRLTQMLGGLPDRVYLRWSRAEGDVPGSIDVGTIAYADERGDFELLGRYRLGLPRPSRILCLTPRDTDEAFSALRERELQRERDGAGAPEGEGLRFAQSAGASLGFSERNGYPSSARFLVCDQSRLMRPADEAELAPGEASPNLGYLDDYAWLRFWLGVWGLAQRPADAWDLQAYALYRLRVHVNRDLLASSIQDTYERWGVARAEVANQLELERVRLRASEQDVHDLPTFEVSIQVPFDRVVPQDLFVSGRPLGLFKDVPQKDMETWNRERDRSDAAYRALLKAPRRSLRLASADFRRTRGLTREDLEYCVLNATEREELDERLADLETRLARGVGERPFEGGRQQRSTREAADAIVDAIDERPRTLQGLKALGLSSGALFAGFCALAAIGLLTNGLALFVALTGSGILAASGLSAAWGLRHKLADRYDAYNAGVRANYAALADEASSLGRRFSDYATFRRGWSIRERQGHLDRPTRTQDELERMDARLGHRMEELSVLAAASAVSLAVPNRSPLAEPWPELARALADDSYYAFLPNRRGRRLGMSHGAAPDGSGPGFVASLELERLRVL